MKLIIDIPEHIQIACKDMIENTDLESMELHRHIIREIAEGIPLEDIKVDIEFITKENGMSRVHIDDIRQILDKHIKENKQ